jgi:hypothetical protein
MYFIHWNTQRIALIPNNPECIRDEFNGILKNQLPGCISRNIAMVDCFLLDRLLYSRNESQGLMS